MVGCYSIKTQAVCKWEKVIITVALCWVIPVLVLSPYIAAYFINKKPITSSSIKQYVGLGYYHHLAVFSFFVDFIFIVSYIIIIYTLFARNQNLANENVERWRKQNKKMFLLCISYASVFVVATSLFIIIYLVPRKVPDWLETASMMCYTGVGTPDGR